jgi:predicted ATP-dependent endonuclease of OLD family
VLRHNSLQRVRLAIITSASAGDLFEYIIKKNLKLKGRHRTSDYYESDFKKYVYEADQAFIKSNSAYLTPPFGRNLPEVLTRHEDLRNQIVKLFNGCDLTIDIDIKRNVLKLAQHGGFEIPYRSSAETLQRMTFYKSAIESNKNSILLFEDPDAHSFSPYLVHFTQDVIYNVSNQYFISTRSPFVLNDLLENGLSDLAVFVVYRNDLGTNVKRLSDEQLREMIDYGIDIFTNNEAFTG